MVRKPGTCEICENKYYSDIYQHRKTGSHKRRMNGEVEPEKKKMTASGICEICDNRLYSNVSAHRTSNKHNENVAKRKRMEEAENEKVEETGAGKK